MSKCRKGVSAVEVLVVIAILACVAGVVHSLWTAGKKDTESLVNTGRAKIHYFIDFNVQEVEIDGRRYHVFVNPYGVHAVPIKEEAK